MRWALTVCASIACFGCASSGTAGRSKGAGLGSYGSISYSDAPLSPNTRIFLVAGGDDIANFAQEVVNQRALWRKAGFSHDEIACYYAKPTKKAYTADRRQYERLARRLKDCYAANPATVRAHMVAIAEQRPPFVYLYVTGHGTHSFLEIAGAPPKPSQCGTRPKIESDGERALLDDYALGLNADPGPALGDVCGVLRGHRSGRSRGELMFSPPALRELLERFPSSTRKVVVLQGCFSGGFVGRADGGLRADLITAVPNLVAMTATRHDRSSFGCGPGESMSYFGGAFLRALKGHVERGVTPATVDWRAIYDRVVRTIEVMEKVEGERPSHPRYFTNVDEP